MDLSGYRRDCANSRTLGYTKPLGTFDCDCIIADLVDAKDPLYFSNEGREFLRKKRIVLGGVDEAQQFLPYEIFQRIAETKTGPYALCGCTLFNP
jgi:hypothetical protein